MVSYDVISQDQWNSLPTGKGERKPSEWDGLLSDLAAGKIVHLAYSDMSDRRKKRLSIARRAATWGFKTEARYSESHLAIRRTDLSSPVPAEPPRPERQRRSGKTKAPTPKTADEQPL